MALWQALSVACPHKERCPMFEKFQMQTALRMWVSLYCDRDENIYGRCARFRIAKLGEMPAPNLLPNGEVLLQVRSPGKKL